VSPLKNVSVAVGFVLSELNNERIPRCLRRGASIIEEQRKNRCNQVLAGQEQTKNSPFLKGIYRGDYL
jgi:hypothetical protein